MNIEGIYWIKKIIIILLVKIKIKLHFIYYIISIFIRTSINIHNILLSVTNLSSKNWLLFEIAYKLLRLFTRVLWVLLFRLTQSK